MSNSFATPWTKAYQTPLFMRFPRQEYWTEYCHFIFQEIFQTLGLNLCLLHCGWILYSWATKEAILRVWAPNKRATIYMMWKLVETKGEIDRHIIIVGYFNIFLPMLDKTSQKATRVQKNSIMTPINQLNVIDIYQTLHLKENIHFFSSSRRIYMCHSIICSFICFPWQCSVQLSSYGPLPLHQWKWGKSSWSWGKAQWSSGHFNSATFCTH